MVFNSDIHINGDVRIDDHAVIAPGVVIIAAPNCSVAIASGVCLGMGCILQAHQGNIEIHQGAMIGAGVLMIGAVTVGENTCVGYGSTIFQASLASGIVLPPNSLVGDTSRQAASQSSTTQATVSKSPASQATDPWATEIPSPKYQSTENSAEKTRANALNETESVQTEITESETEVLSEKTPKSPKEPVVGQVYINQLLMTLFPHNTPIKPPDSSQS